MSGDPILGHYAAKGMRTPEPIEPEDPIEKRQLLARNIGRVNAAVAALESAEFADDAARWAAADAITPEILPMLSRSGHWLLRGWDAEWDNRGPLDVITFNGEPVGKLVNRLDTGELVYRAMNTDKGRDFLTLVTDGLRPSVRRTTAKAGVATFNRRAI